MIQGVGCVVRYSNVSGGVISGYVAAAADGIVVIIVIGMMIAGIIVSILMGTATYVALKHVEKRRARADAGARSASPRRRRRGGLAQA